MAENSKIEWCDHTNNLWEGCTRVHEGCDNCYAATPSKRYGKSLWGNDVPRRFCKKGWTMFNKWQLEAAAAGTYALVFVGSMMDIFEKSMPVVNNDGSPRHEMPDGTMLEEQVTTDHLRSYFFNEIVPKYPNLMFLLLTKRPSNIHRMVPIYWLADGPPANVFFGASIVNQETLKMVSRQLAHKLPRSFNTFWSIEPLLSAVDFSEYGYRYKPKWVIVGGESGDNYRPFSGQWARAVRDWCKENDISFFMKQMGGRRKPFAPIPPDIAIREFPVQFNTLFTDIKPLK